MEENDEEKDIFKLAADLPSGDSSREKEKPSEEEVETEAAGARREPTDQRSGQTAAVTEKSGDVVGPYRLLQQIGEGGFGTVWMAEQSEPISRRVALKVIKAGMDTGEVLARFEAERQALAMMDHENIARVLDAGATDTGRPYFVMELVKGVPVTEFCDGQKLDTRARLELFGAVCEAVSHAHQKGIIHRDLKPSNVMVTLHGSKPVVKVIDFGIAKATQGKLTDRTLFTRFEQFLGTPAYMSPEQAALSGLDIDTRSDIYSLGVLLYELLSGSPPFDPKDLVSAGYDEMRRIIREEEPPRPSLRLSTVSGEAESASRITTTHGAEPQRLSRLVRGDLDWIVMKAIEKDRTRRYETVNAFAADIGRFLCDEPVEAAAPSAAYKFRKFARRNRTAIGVAALITGVLVVATGVSSWQAREAREAREAEAGQREIAEAKAEEAEERAEEAEAIAAYLAEVFQSPDPARDGRTVTVAEMLDRAVEKLETDLTDQPERRARLQGALGMTYFALGLYPQSITLWEKVRDFYLANGGPERPDTLLAMSNLASSLHLAGRLEEALEYGEEVVALSLDVNGPEHVETLSRMQNLVGIYHEAGRRGKAMKMQEKVLVLRRKALGPEHPGTLAAMHNLALCYRDAGRREETLKMQEEVLALRSKVLGPEHPETLAAMHNLGLSYHDAGRVDEALKVQEEVLALRRRVLGPEHPETLAAMHNLGLSCHDAGRLDEALKLQEEVLALRRRVLGTEHPGTLRAMNNLATFHYEAGRLAEALELGKEALELCRRILGAEHPATLSAMHNLALSYGASDRSDEKLRMQEEVFSLRRQVLGPEHSDTLKAMHNLASSYGKAGRLDDELAMEEEVLVIRRKVLGLKHPDTLIVMNNLASSYHDAGRLDAALKLREEVLELFREVNGPLHPYTLGAMRNLALSLETAARRDEALRLREEAESLAASIGEIDGGTVRRDGDSVKVAPAAERTFHSPLGFHLGDLAGKNEAERSAMLGEADLVMSGMDRDEETGIEYDEERSYAVKGFTLDLFLLGGNLTQINLSTDFDEKLSGLESLAPYLGVPIKNGEGSETAAGDATSTVHRIRVNGSGEWRIYGEFGDTGTDSVKLVLPQELDSETAPDQAD